MGTSSAIRKHLGGTQDAPRAPESVWEAFGNQIS